MVDRVEHLYCGEGRTLAAVAELTGIPLRTLKSWCGRFGWVEKKREVARTLAEIRHNTILLRGKLLEHCLEVLDAREANIVLSRECRIRREDGNDTAGAARPFASEMTSAPDSDTDAAAALEKACRAWIRILSIDPGRLDASTVRGLKSAMELSGELRERGKPADSGGLSDEVAEQIRRKILGIYDD